MRQTAAIALASVMAIASACGTAQPDTLPPDWGDAMLSDWFEGPARIHQAVQFHESQPLSETAEEIQPILAAHYKTVDYIICGHVLDPLFGSDNEIHQIIAWQIIFGSGDWVEQHPEQGDNIDAYTVAGLESGLRAYATALDENSKARSELLDELLALYRSNRLHQWYADHPCRPM
jgi:hypothetical protein